MTETERAMNDRLYTAMIEASRLRRDHSFLAVAIHVGQGPWDYLHLLNEREHSFDPGMLFGFPLMLEAAWEPSRIEIKASMVIA